MPDRPRAALLPLVLLLAVAGCSRSPAAPPVPVAVPTADPSGCRDFAERLPESLADGVRRRATSPGDHRVAAYGDPPVVVRCGAPVPTAFRQGSPLVVVSGVDWFQEVGAREVRWSTPTAFVNVEVVVPTAYEAHGGMLARLAEAVRATSGGF